MTGLNVIRAVALSFLMPDLLPWVAETHRRIEELERENAALEARQDHQESRISEWEQAPHT